MLCVGSPLGVRGEGGKEKVEHREALRNWFPVPAIRALGTDCICQLLTLFLNMLLKVRLICVVAFLFLCSGISVNAQDLVEAPPTSATDHKVRIHRVKRANNAERATERHGRSLKKRKATGVNEGGKESKVYKRHRHFAEKEIRIRAKSKSARKGALGVDTE
jgi:hypothetical protein